MKRSLVLLSLVFGLASFAMAKETIVLAVFPPLDKAYVDLVKEFNKVYPDIEVNIKVAGFSDHHNALQVQMASGRGVPDVAVVEVAFIGQLGAAGGFENLMSAPYNAGRYRTNFVRYAWDQASVNRTTVIGIPIDIGPACAFWRVDLLEKAGLPANQYLQVKSMQDLFDIGAKVTIDTDGDGKKDQWLLSEPGQLFNIILKSDSTRYFGANGKPVLNRPLVREAALWAKRFYQAGYCANISAWTSEWYSALGNPKGGIVFNPQGSWLAGQLEKNFGRALVGKYRVSHLPSLSAAKNARPMYSSDGGSFLCIPKKATYKSSAWKFIEYMTTRTDAQIAAFKKMENFPAWLPSWKDPAFNEPIAYLGGQKARVLWQDIAKRVPAVFVNENDSIAAAILSAHVTEVIMNNADVDKELAAAQAEMEDQL